jgi:hypothetical protein
MISPLPRSAAGAARGRGNEAARSRLAQPRQRGASRASFSKHPRVSVPDPSAHSKQHFALRQLLGVSSRPVGRFSSVLFSPYGGVCNLSSSSILKVFCDVH